MTNENVGNEESSGSQKKVKGLIQIVNADNIQTTKINISVKYFISILIAVITGTTVVIGLVNVVNKNKAEINDLRSGYSQLKELVERIPGEIKMVNEVIDDSNLPIVNLNEDDSISVGRIIDGIKLLNCEDLKLCLDQVSSKFKKNCKN